MKCVHFKFLIAVAIMATLTTSVDGLSCHTCTSASGSDPNCETNPKDTPVARCPLYNNYCQMWSTRNGPIFTMVRGCVHQPLFANGTHSSGQTTVTYKSCQTDACNSSPATFAGFCTVTMLMTVVALVLSL